MYGWFNRWEWGGLTGLANAKGQGRPAILQPADQERVEIAVRANRQRLKDVTAVLRQELGKDFSALTLKRFLKRVGQMAALPPRPENGPGPGRVGLQSGPIAPGAGTEKRRCD